MRDSAGTIVMDSARDAWAHTRTALFQRFDLGLWLKLAFIAMLGANVGGGGGANFSLPAPGGGEGEPGAEIYKELTQAFSWVQQHVAELFALFVGFAVVALVLAFAVFYLRCVFRFIFVDAVRLAGRRPVRDAWSLFQAQGLSLLGWYVVLGLAAIALLGVALLPVLVGTAALASGKTLLAVLGVGGLVAVIAMVTVVVIVIALLQALSQEFLVPTMYARHCGVMEGWRTLFAAWRGRFWDVVLYFLLKLAIAIGLAMAAVVLILPMLLLLVPAGLGAGALAALGAALGGEGPHTALYAGVLVVPGLAFLLTLAYLLNCVFLPVTFFLQAYAMSFVGRMDPRLRTL